MTGVLTLVFNENLDKVLLLQKDVDSNQSVWSGFHGKVETFDESYIAAARRELHELTTISTYRKDLGYLLKLTFRDETQLFVFTGVVTQGIERQTTRSAIGWFSVSEVFDGNPNTLFARELPFFVDLALEHCKQGNSH